VAYLIVFAGAGLGGAIRHAFNVAGAGLWGTSFPYTTALINVLGSFLMGVFAEYFALRGQWPQEWRLFLTTGVLGGYTTFSAFSLEAALLWERSDYLGMGAYIFGSVVLSILGLFAGLALMRAVV
jgi:CrcB protein